MNILITGGVGYVGYQIASQYKNDKNFSVVCVDSRFEPATVADLVKMGVKFVHKDLFQTSDLLDKSDLIYHCAGITAVPQTVSQSNPTIDAEIERVGTEGTRHVIKHSNKKSKIVFLSTHVVFEGNSYNGIPFSEKDPATPLLAYGKSKLTSETDLLNGDRDFSIGRLASVYGYNRAIRWKILPNLFSKMAALGEPLKVFGGNNYKPVVGINDAARALKFLSDPKFNGEIFHICNESYKVREIAEICAIFAPKTVINETNDETPNSGYLISFQKMLDSGFEFDENLMTGISEMIFRWSV